jgi:NAD(P)H-hydrate epimerase
MNEHADDPRLPLRPADGHKGTFGTVCVLGGQAAPPRVMLGGPALAALAALRAGAGLAVLAVPEPVLREALVVAPSATGLALPVDRAGRLLPSAVAELLDEYLGGYDCLALGPGLGADAPQQQVIARLAGLRSPPLVIDADALNALSRMPDFQGDLHAAAVLTPHPGEYRRLARVLSIDSDPTYPAERWNAAEQLARRLGCVVVLKGAGTIVSDGINTWLNATGNAALATAGTGDVLTGLIAGLVAQHHGRDGGGLSLYECARAAVHAHGLAADRWRDRHGDGGMMASDLLAEIPSILASLRAPC